MFRIGGGLFTDGSARAVRRRAAAMGAILAVACGAATATAPPAHAGTLLGSLTGALPGTGPASSLKDAFTRSPTDLTTALACPVVDAVSDATAPIPGVGTLTNQLDSVICALNVLGYAYRTTYLPPSGTPIVRYYRATALVPAPLDVDGNGLPDFTGTLLPSLAPTGLTLSINRVSFPADAKVSIEAVLLNPASPDGYVGFGEDGTKAGTAGGWTGTLGVLALSTTTADLALHLNAAGRPASLGIMGEVFSGSDPDAPQKTSRGNVGFTPVPQSLNTEVRLSQTRQQVLISSAIPTTASAHADVIVPGDQKDVDVVIDQLPASIDVVHQTLGGHENTTYTANAGIASLTGAYHDRSGTTIETAARLDALAVPKQIVVDQVGGRTAIGTGSGAFGSVEARFATGGEVPAPGAGTAPYAAFRRFGAGRVAGGIRLTNLRSLSFDLSGPYGGELVFAAPLPALPLSAQDDVSGIAATGSLSNLPLDTSVTADMPGGVITFDGHGQGISQIALHATKTGGTFFTRASRLDATIDNLPAANTFNIKQSDGTVSVAAAQPIGTISLLASDGADAPAVDPGAVAWYEDTPGRYRAFARISNFTGLSFRGDPFAGAIDTALPQVLSLHGEAGGATFDGKVDKLPAHIGFSMMPKQGGGQVLDYNSNGAMIDTITVDATGLTLPTGGGHFHGRIEHLPSHMALTLPPSGGKIVLDTFGTHIGRVLAQVYGPDGPADAAPGHQQLYYSEQTTQVTVDLHDVGSLQLIPGTAPLYLSYDISHDPLDFGVNLNGGTFLGGTVSNPQPATLSVDASLGLRAFYQVNAGGPNFTGTGQIDGIDIETNAAGGYLEGHLQNVPGRMLICVLAEKGTLCKPSWVPLQATAGGDTYTVPVPDFAFQLLPTDLNGNVPATPLEFNGRFCPTTPDPGTCRDNSAKRERVVISHLRFNTVEAGYGSADDGCHVACGRVWAGFGTNNDHITGRVASYDDGEDDPTFDFNAPDPDGNGPDPGSFLAADKLFFFLAYDAVSFDPLAVTSSGSVSCGSPKPKAEYETPGPNFDLLGGTFGVCP